MLLSDYFQPLNPTTLILFFVLLISFDLWGTFVKSILIKRQSQDGRIINWLIGLGFFSFFWFLSRFFLPPNQLLVASSIVVLDLITLPYYLKSRELGKFIAACWQFRYPFLMIVPFLPAVFVKASLPPYYSDEMAYHFISPSQLLHISTWHFDGDFYPNLPQVFDLFFVLIFSLTKTYSVVRLFIFTSLITSFLFTFSFLKKHFGRLPAYFFVFSFFSLPQAIVHLATVGFVDVPTFSLMLVGLILLIEFFINSQTDSLLLSSIFWGMSLGTKYTALSAFASILPITVCLAIYKLKLRSLLLPPLLLLIFGGYWYVKNLLVYGNPLYPMFGGASIPFSGSWTTQIDLVNIKKILGELFPQNTLLQLFVIISPIYMFFNNSKRTRYVSILIFTSVILELIALKKFSGFYARYHQHLQLWSLLLLSIQLSNQYKKRWLKITSNLAYSALFVSLVFSYHQSIRITYLPSSLSAQEINYSTGRINIYDWISAELPRVSDIIRWCENPPGGEVLIRLIDPDMIWYEKEGFMRSFLTKCYLEKGIPLEGTPLIDLLSVAVDKKIKFITPSINQCLPDIQVGPKRIIKDDLDERTIYLRHISNRFLCHSQEIIPHLYYFSYENLNP